MTIARSPVHFLAGECPPRVAPQGQHASYFVRAAVAAHPFMVAGAGRFDTEVMKLLGARAFTKTGAEGVFCAALPALGLGVAVKADDGEQGRQERAAVGAGALHHHGGKIPPLEHQEAQPEQSRHQ